MSNNALTTWIDEVQWDSQGLVPVIAQEVGTGDVLMFAWMNREALQKTAELGRAVYFSRSRGKLWAKGEESGQVQTVHEIRIDCDNDVLLLKVSQPAHPSESLASSGQSIACHTGRHSCFYSVFKRSATQGVEAGTWEVVDPVLKDPATLYK